MKFTQLIVIFIATLSPIQLFASEENRAAEQLAATLASITELKAAFEQQMIDESGELLDEASGWFAWQRPDKFRWETLLPVEQSILIDSEQYYQYDRDLDQLLIQPLSADIGVLPKLLLSGNAEKIQQKFAVAISSSEGTAIAYNLTPVDSAALFVAITLEFKDDKLHSMSMIDELGQNNLFVFSAQNDKDEKIAALFELKPSPETEIIYQ